jgi:DNA-directed RNA polymerase specialized sigma24 family protein
MKKVTTNYINNKKLYTTLIEYKRLVKEAKEEGREKPILTRYVAEAIMLICSNLAKKSNFSGYTYKEEFIGDAIIDCLAAVDNFNPDKTNNPFAYFSQVAWNAFIRRIQKEKKQTYIKHKNYRNMFDDASFGLEGEQIKNNEFHNDVIESFEKKLTSSKKKSKISVGVEQFQEE